MHTLALIQCLPDAFSRLVSWYLNVGASEEGPHEALFAIASVSAVIWTGGLILRDRLPKERFEATNDLLRLNVAMDALQTSFVGALLAMLATPLVLRSIAFICFAYYFIADSVVAVRLLPRLGWWLAGEYFIDAAMLLIALVPHRGPAAWACVLLLGFGYQLMLRLFYRLRDFRGEPFKSPPS